MQLGNVWQVFAGVEEHLAHRHPAAPEGGFGKKVVAEDGVACVHDQLGQIHPEFGEVAKTLGSFFEARVEQFVLIEHVQEEGAHIGLRTEQHHVSIGRQPSDVFHNLRRGEADFFAEAGRQKAIVVLIHQGGVEQVLSNGPILLPVRARVGAVVQRLEGGLHAGVGVRRVTDHKAVTVCAVLGVHGWVSSASRWFRVGSLAEVTPDKACTSRCSRDWANPLAL